MKNMNLFGKTMVSVAVLAAFGGANAATGRNGATTSNSLRMPTMPTVSLNTIGNPAVNTVSTPSGVTSGGIPNPIPNPNPGPIPGPTPTPCDDGGVANSSYTITMCMDDLLQCVNTGALQGGINDLFNADVRNSIMTGMKLCQGVVDKCVSEVRVDCRKIYKTSNDVWLDFNSRVIQPEYYNFVLRKTGLTPNQAENTCLLLDRNTYGESFASVSDTNVVNTEYNNYVGAYNRQENNTLSKDNPQGVKINDTGYDGNRGHYARWDASKAECLIRVAAYNKDKLITNSWLFGAVGDDTPAEVWQKAGSTFTCNKDLFDFSLMNQTKTTAVVSVPTGALLGAGIGAAAGAGAYDKKMKDLYGEDYDSEANADMCANKEYRDRFAKYFKSNVDAANTLATYLDGKNFSDLLDIDESECKKILDLWSMLPKYEEAIKLCDKYVNNKRDTITKVLKIDNVTTLDDDELEAEGITAEMVCPDEEVTVNVSKCVQNIVNDCKYHSLKKIDLKSVYCEGGPTDDCVDINTTDRHVKELRSLLSGIQSLVGRSVKQPNKGAEIGKGVAIGTVTGAGVGGIVTGITALVEKNNISCKVGDGLNSVSLGKSHTIDSLKDFYVKWNLKLPDTITPTSVVSDVASWQQACAQFNSRLMDCPNVQINLKRPVDKNYTLVNAACKQSGSMCIPNDAVMNSMRIE